MTRPVLPFGLPVAVLALTTGCEPYSAIDYLQVSFPSPAKVDTDCTDGGCEELVALDVVVEWPDDPVFLDGSEVHIYQYKVEYSFSGIDEEIPYYAGLSDQTVPVGDSASFTITPIGNVQRDLLAGLVPEDEIYTGTGTVTFAGWDEKNEVIEFPVGGSTFQISAGNFSALATQTGTTGTTGTTTTSSSSN